MNCIGLATKSFRFFPLDDFSRSKSFFSIANFRPYMVLDMTLKLATGTWRPMICTNYATLFKKLNALLATQFMMFFSFS